jgi:glycosyltransferase involved in cell wall biosynthesis
MKYSVIVPASKPTALHYTLYALSMQSVKLDEVLVVQSTSDSKDRKGIATEAEKFGAKIVQCKKPDSRAAARNAGIDAARNELLLFVDDDTILNTNFVSNLSLYMAFCFLKDFVFHSFRSEMEPCFTEQFYKKKIKDDDFKKFLIEFREPGRIDNLNMQADPPLALWHLPITSNLTVKKSTIKKFDLYFDENFEGWGEEDIEWDFRALLTDKIQFIIPRPPLTNWHLNHDFDIQKRIETFRKNVKYFITKHPVMRILRADLYKQPGMNLDGII